MPVRPIRTLLIRFYYWLRPWARDVFDVLAALFAGFGVILIVVGYRPIPTFLLTYLGFPWAIVWCGFLVLGSLLAATGAFLRATRWHQGSYLFELLGWPTIGFCGVVFGLGAEQELGLLDAATTVGFAGFVACISGGQWVRLFQARRQAVRLAAERRVHS